MNRLNTTSWNRIRYSVYAPFYDLVGLPLQPYRRRAIQLLRPEPAAKLLVVGAGTGLDLVHLQHLEHVTLTDLSSAMVTRIRRRALRLGMNATAATMDAQALDFPDASFDFVVCHLILAVVPDPTEAIKEVARVLKPGGSISIFDKFLRHGATPSRFRVIADAISGALFSELNREVEPLLQTAGLTVRHDEPALLNGLFRIIIARKESST